MCRAARRSVGKAANDEANGRVFQLFNIDETWTPLETVISGDRAYQRGTFAVDATPKAGGNPRSATSSSCSFIASSAQASWHMTRDMFNSDAPPAAGDRK